MLEVHFHKLIDQAHDEKAIGMSADPVSRTFWIYTDRSILEVLVQTEDRDVWRAKLERNEFAEALQFARVGCNKLRDLTVF